MGRSDRPLGSGPHRIEAARWRVLGAVTAAALLLASGLAVSGCGTDSTSGLATTPTAAAALPSATAATGTSAGGSFLACLRSIADNPGNRNEVWLTNYTRMRQQLGVALPLPASGSQTYIAYLAAVAGPGALTLAAQPFLGGHGQYAQVMTQTARYLGFDIQNVDQGAVAGVAPEKTELMRGSFDPSATAKAIAACTACDKAQTKEYKGSSYFSWGGDLAINIDKRLAPPAYDELGRGGRLLVQKDLVIRTLSDKAMEAMIGAARGDAPVLSSVAALSAAAAALDGANAYTGLVSDRSQDASTGAPRGATPAPQPQSLLLRPYIAFATGGGKDARGFFMILVLVHGSDDAAKQNAVLLPKRIAEYVLPSLQAPWSSRVDQLEVTQQGLSVVAKMWGERVAKAWQTWYVRADPLIAHE